MSSKPAAAHHGGTPGLSAEEVAERVRSGQTNQVPTRTSRGTAAIVRANVFTRFNALIGSLFVVILIVGPVQDTLFGFVILANTGIGIVQELRAKRTLDRLAVLGQANARVRRDATVREIPPDEVVLGDTLVIGSGDKVVVDGIVRDADALEVDESLLTGEQEPVPKLPGDQLLSGSFAVAGGGAYEATRVGRAAYAATLAEEASRFTLVRSELRTGIDRFLRIITWLIVPTAVLLAVTQYLTRASLPDAIRGTVAGVVTMVPEGLVLLTSIAFAVGVIRLGARQCLVQELPALEGLARVDVVCADKTGTLTEPQMSLVEVRLLGPVTAVHDVEESGAGDPGAGGHPAAGAEHGAGGPHGPTGDHADSVGPTGEEAPQVAGPAGAPTRPPARTRGQEVGRALAALAASTPRPNTSLQAIAAACPDDPHWTLTAAAPFSPVTRWSGASFAGHGTWILGAPEVLLPDRHPAGGTAERLAHAGIRVLVLGRSDRAADQPGAPGHVEPVALLGLEQVVRPDAAPTLRYFADQGVAVKVISGDNAVTVAAVAARIGLSGSDEPVDARTMPSTVDGQDSGGPDDRSEGLESHATGDEPVVPAEAPPRPERMGLPELAEYLERHTVYGRVAPQQKRIIVQALQYRGHTVAMTGDGVNDVLALKDADIGVAMGSGSDAARAVAQIVLLDNRFATLPVVVAEGRRVIGNIERVAGLFLTKTVYAMVLAITVGVARLPFPFLPRHLTLVGSLTIGIPAFFLALAPNTDRVRSGMVPRVLRFAVPAGAIAAAASFSSYYLAHRNATTLAVDRTTATIALMTAGFGALTALARPLAWWKCLLIGAMIGCGVMTLAVPVLRSFFALPLPDRLHAAIALAVGAAAWALIEGVGWLMRRRARED